MITHVESQIFSLHEEAFAKQKVNKITGLGIPFSFGAVFQSFSHPLLLLVQAFITPSLAASYLVLLPPCLLLQALLPSTLLDSDSLSMCSAPPQNFPTAS